MNDNRGSRVVLELYGFTVGYGRRRVIEDFTATTGAGGHVVGLLGPNASGKSTLIESIVGIHVSGVGQPRAGGRRVAGGVPCAGSSARYSRVCLTSRN
ncbi:hypothetical protein [Corynebacterium meridianum]|uniref:hypothetical protein n=1 Tax=Corynebacterium meridianum TaxID=2765363 RepID=UPI001E40EE4E|nr:hypothetical protein [Corynebacterium meridianum]